MKHKIYVNIQNYISDVIFSIILSGKYNLIDNMLELNFSKKFSNIDEYITWATKQIINNLKKYSYLIKKIKDLQEFYEIIDNLRTDVEVLFDIEQLLRVIIPISLYIKNKENIYEGYFELLECFLEEQIISKSMNINTPDYKPEPNSPMTQFYKNNPLNDFDMNEFYDSNYELTKFINEKRKKPIMDIIGSTDTSPQRSPRTYRIPLDANIDEKSDQEDIPEIYVKSPGSSIPEINVKSPSILSDSIPEINIDEQSDIEEDDEVQSSKSTEEKLLEKLYNDEPLINLETEPQFQLIEPDNSSKKKQVKEEIQTEKLLEPRPEELVEVEVEEEPQSEELVEVEEEPQTEELVEMEEEPQSEELVELVEVEKPQSEEIVKEKEEEEPQSEELVEVEEEPQSEELVEVEEEPQSEELVEVEQELKFRKKPKPQVKRKRKTSEQKRNEVIEPFSNFIQNSGETTEQFEERVFKTNIIPVLDKLIKYSTDFSRTKLEKLNCKNKNILEKAFDYVLKRMLSEKLPPETINYPEYKYFLKKYNIATKRDYNREKMYELAMENSNNILKLLS
jgi:hypothetical protein